MSDEQQPRDALKTRVTIAKHLRTVEELALDLHTQALASPNARDFPGGDALHMLAPAIAQQDWLDRYAEAEERSFDEDKPLEGWNDPLIYQGDTDNQPLNVLATWTRMVREERDQQTDLKPTISREVDYLRGSLDWMCRLDAWGEPEWPLCFELAGELRTLVRRMEDVLHDGIRLERTEIPCINTDCETKPRLIKVWSMAAIRDGYKCPKCALNYDQAQFLQAKAANLRSHNSEKWVLATDATEALELPVQTVRAWIRRETIQTRWDNGRLHVWWPDMREAAETRRTNKLAKTLSRGA